MLSLLPLAAVDSLNLLAFSVIGVLWVGSSRARFSKVALAFLAGGIAGVMTAFALSLSVLGPQVRELMPGTSERSFWMLLTALGVILVVLGVLGLKGGKAKDIPGSSPPSDEECLPQPNQAPPFPVPVDRPVLVFLVGFAIYMGQNFTSIPFFTAVTVLFAADLALRWVGVAVFIVIALCPAAFVAVLLHRASAGRGRLLLEKVQAFSRASTKVLALIFLVLGGGLILWCGLTVVCWTTLGPLNRELLQMVFGGKSPE